VIVSGNLFGDMLSDIAATLSGSIGMLPSASLNSSSQGMYEPCHGSAPDIAGEDIANPIAMIASLAMAFEYSLERVDLARRIESAIKTFISQGHRTKDISISEEFMKTQEVAPALIRILKDENE
jgi:3-isopropylmalate dehydrogenase